MIEPKGRMIRRDIARSKKFASLSKDSQILFFMIIPHLNYHGKSNGEPTYIKGACCPLIKFFDVKMIEKCLLEITEKTNLKWFQYEDLWYLHALNWSEHQNLLKDRHGKDYFPDYKHSLSHIQVNDKSVTSHVEVVAKDKDKDKDKDKESFRKPSHVEVSDYAKSIGFILDGQKFCDYYQAKGWMIGKNHMKDWKAAVRTWKLNNRESSQIKEPEKTLTITG